MPFQPPRIWRTRYSDWTLDRCSYDNDFEYAKPGGSTKDVALSNLTIPPAVAWVKHLTWPSDERGRMKAAYQAKHFAHGFGCSYVWDVAANRLIFNPEYYARTRQPLPELARDES